MDNGVGWCDSWDEEIVLMEVNCVRDAEGLSFGVKDTVEGDASIESIGAMEIPGAAGGWFVVDDDRAAKWQERDDIVVEGAIEVCPG